MISRGWMEVGDEWGVFRAAKKSLDGQQIPK